MKLSFHEVREVDKPAIRALVNSQKLTPDGMFSDNSRYFIALHNNDLVGCAGFEFYSRDALLRSVVVAADYQNLGLGTQIVDYMIDYAKRQNVRNIVLLTATARKFFEKKGFRTIQRSDINNQAMLESPEFAFSCCNSAECMIRNLDN